MSCFNYLQRVNGRSKYFFSTSKHMPFTSWKSWMLLIFFKKVVATFSVFLVTPIKYFQKISLKTWKDITRTYFNGQLKTASCFWQFAVWLKKRRIFRLYYSKKKHISCMWKIIRNSVLVLMWRHSSIINLMNKNNFTLSRSPFGTN